MEVYIDKGQELEADQSHGILVIVCGRSGAGKTTLAREALANIPHLAYLRTVTTRQPRSEDEAAHSFEYEFVTHERYETLRREALHWDHSEIYGQWYGADIDDIQTRLAAGTSFIVNCIAEATAVQELMHTYGNRAQVIFLDTPIDVTQTRLREERSESEHPRVIIDSAHPDETLMAFVDHVFIPTGEMTSDMAHFVQLVSGLIQT